MNCFTSPFFGFLFVVVALASPKVFAQYSVGHASLEAQIVQADSVFRGRIVKLESKIIVAPGKRDPNGEVEHRFSVKIEENIKGEAKEIVLVRKTMAIDNRFEHWFENKTEFLWFVQLDKEDQAPSSKTWNATRLTAPVPAEKIFAAQPTVFSMNLSKLSKADAILDCARKFAKRHDEPVPIHSMNIPTSIGGGDACSISVPVTRDLEKNSILMIRSPQEFWPKSYKINSLDAYVLKLAGVTALQYFKSPANIALLEQLLNDTSEVRVHSGDKDPGKICYPIREKSYEILTQWGIDVPEPRLENTSSDNQK